MSARTSHASRTRSATIVASLLLLAQSLTFSAVAAAQSSPEEDQAAIRAAYKQDWSSAPSSAGAQGTGQHAPGEFSTQSAIGPAPGNTIYLGQAYGLRQNNSGTPIGCNIELVSDTPAPTRRIRYGLSLQCNNSAISGQGISHLGEFFPTPLRPLQNGSFFSIAGDNRFYWATQQYDRESETQFEQIYAFFTLNINTPGGVWKTTPTVGGAAYDIQCAGLETSRLTCAMNTAGFPFIPDAAACTTGDLCGPSADPCGAGGVRNTLLRSADLAGTDDVYVTDAMGVGDPNELPDDLGVALPETGSDTQLERTLRSAPACAASASSASPSNKEIRYCAVAATALLNPVVAIAMARRANACNEYAKAVSEALREQNRRFSSPSDRKVNGRGDAFRHCAWQGRIVHRLDAKWAKKFGDLHEDRPDNPAAERDMDQSNNVAGREFGNITKGRDSRAARLYDQCEIAARNGSLKVLNP